MYEPAPLKPRYRWDATLHAWVLQSSFLPFSPMFLSVPSTEPCGYIYEVSEEDGSVPNA